MNEDIKKLEAAAAELVKHPHQGKSPFAGPLRSALGRAAEMAEQHKNWLATNPETKAEKK